MLLSSTLLAVPFPNTPIKTYFGFETAVAVSCGERTVNQAMMDTRCVDTSHGNNTSVSIPGMAMSSAAQAQELGLNNNDTDMIGDKVESSLAAEDARNMPLPPLTITDSTTIQAIGAPFSTQTPTPETSRGIQSPIAQQHEVLIEEIQQSQSLNNISSTATLPIAMPTPIDVDSRNTSEEIKSLTALRGEAAILAAPDTIVSRPLPPQNQHEPQAAKAEAAGETSMGSQTAVSQKSLSSVAHSVVSPISTESDPLARAPPPEQNSVYHHNLFPTGSTMLNPSMVPSSVPTIRPAAVASSTPAAAGISYALNSYPMTNILPPPSPDSRFKNTVCSSTIAAAGVGPGGGDGLSPKKKCAYPLRRGKWTTEEESYANRLIHEFKSGLLPLTDGTTLRNFLSKLLNCDPMRISKKFVGNNCIGKQVFRRRVPEINRLSPEQIRTMCLELSE
jgi:hypothetical protein